MKKNKILYILLMLVIGISTVSCQDEFESKEENLNQNIKEETVINGRFNFSSTESLNQMIKELNTKDITVIENEFETYYRNGFRSHNPIINPNNEELLAKFSQEYSQKKGNQNKSSENEDDDESFIADPLFAALINDNNEIIVGDTIYKFTKNKGLYFANVKDSVHLINFVENKELNSKSNIIKREELMLDPCEVRAMNGGITQIDESISMYITPIDEINGCTGGGSTGGGTIPSVPQTTDEEKLQEIISNLPVCEGKDNWINNLFGKSYWCIEHFDDRHRIKTEFWDQKWLIYASSGIFTKTQVRTLGVYWASDSDEIHLGINRILLRYNFSQPDYKSLTHPNLFNTYKAPLYMYKGDFMVDTGNYYVNTTIEVTKNSIPFFDFESSDILNIYIPNAPLIGDFNLNLTTQDITSQSNIKALYKMGIDFLKDKFNSGAKKEFAIIHQKNLNEIEVIYFGERYKNTNDNKIEHKFYSDVSFLISTTWNDSGSGGNWKYTVKPAQENFRNYTYYELDFYGLARRGTTWKGSRMIR